MKVEVIKKGKSYPWVGKHRSLGKVVLFTGSYRGFVLKNSESNAQDDDDTVGDYHAGWAEDEFIPCSVTITND